MGISTIPSYCGAQIFEAVGLAPELVDRHFTGTPSRIGGIGLDVLARETLDRHARAYPGSADGLLPVGGLYAWRRDGEFHPWNPETIALLQHAVRAGELRDLRGVLAARQRRRRRAARRCAACSASATRRDGGIPLDEVEPAKEIVKRFSTGAMSLGSLGARRTRRSRSR